MFLQLPQGHELLIKSIKRGNMVCCRGGGYTYGDMILNANQIILDTKQMNKIIHFDLENGEIIVESGVTVASILKLSLTFDEKINIISTFVSTN